MNKYIKKSTIFSSLLGIVLTFILAISLSATTMLKPYLDDGKSSKYKLNYKVNENGETYGSSANAISPEAEPDLIEAMGTNGKIGYIRSKALQKINEIPNTIEEALANQEKLQELTRKARQEGKDYIYEIPLYAVDGKTVIDTFRIGGIPLPEECKIIEIDPNMSVSERSEVMSKMKEEFYNSKEFKDGVYKVIAFIPKQ